MHIASPGPLLVHLRKDVQSFQACFDNPFLRCFLLLPHDGDPGGALREGGAYDTGPATGETRQDEQG